MKFSLGILLALLLYSFNSAIHAQAKLGINTLDPLRNLEVVGEGNQNISIWSTTNLGGSSGIEFVSSNNSNIDTDWRIINESFGLRFLSGDYNTYSFENETMRFSPSGDLGIGTTSPQSKLHIDGGTQALLSGGGYLTMGFNNSFNVAIDNTTISARNNGTASPFYIQPYGGNTIVNQQGGNVIIANAAGLSRVGIGTSEPTQRMSIHSNGFQMSFRNPADDTNEWFIGATGSGWAVGPDQLIFSPSNGSSASVFRLHNVYENNGQTGPVTLNSDGQRMIFDGNEIETTGTLYINHNSEQNTLLNVVDGNVGIGTVFPQTKLHIVSPNSEAMSLTAGGVRWDINPATNLVWSVNNLGYAGVDGATGQWFSISDARQKSDIKHFESTLDKLLNVNTYAYSFKGDPENRTYLGVIAQEIEDQFPELVHRAQGQFGVSYGPLASVTLSAISEQQLIIEDLNDKICKLKLLIESRSAE